VSNRSSSSVLFDELEYPPPVRTAAPGRATRARGRRIALKALVAAAAATAVVAVPVVSGAGNDNAPAALNSRNSTTPSSAPVAERAPNHAPVQPGVDGVPRAPEESPAPAATPPATGSGTEVIDAAAGGSGIPGSDVAPGADAAQTPSSLLSAADWGAPACGGPGRTVTRPVGAGAVLTSQWEIPSAPDDVTYDLSGITSTAYPATASVFAVGVKTAGLRTCIIGGTVIGDVDDDRTWEYYHDEYNAACVKILAREWMQVRRVRCDGVEDGMKPQEPSVNANNAQFYISGTYLTNIRDDCMENDYTVGGVLYDNLWEQCNTGISERPSRDRSWRTPESETLVLDRMLIGLYRTPHVEDGRTVMGENALFKWSDSGNRVVIKCSIFKVDEVSLNGTGTMAMPPGTVVDDSECPYNPSTIVWLGGGDYPAWTAGMRVVSDPAVWDRAVAEWKARHGY
jgi:hypothetical protein